MGDAVRDGDVHAADPEETIDGEAPRPEPAATGLPVEVIAATRDYRELLGVERHHYAITRELARGGIGRVFEARDLRLGRQVAIKELLPKNRDAARRFEREARITARLQHPAIIHVYEAGVWPGGEPFYAMPLVSGRSLDKVVAEKNTLDERLGLLPNVIAVADALAYAHNANVIHRDLKPANVLVGEFGETVVIDWGLAKDLGATSDPKESMQMRMRATAEETMSGSVVGTPAYMPPEQARGEPLDQRADVYALGALLYKVLVGEPPYDGKSGKDVLEQVKAGSPVPVQKREPSTPPDLVAIVAKAMARDVDRRYITANELAQDLKRFETGQLVGAHRYTIGELMRRWLRRHRVAVAIAVAALLALISFGVVAVQRIVTEKRNADASRWTLLEERGRAELLGGHAGAALAYLQGAAKDGKTGGARGFLIADAMRPFVAEQSHISVGRGEVVVAASPDGTHIATAGGGAIELRGSDGALTRRFGTFARTHVIAFDATGSKLVAAGDDRVARVFALDGSLLAELRGHTGAIRAAVFDRDGQRLVTASDDAAVMIWDLATKQPTIVDCQHLGPVVSARLSPRGDHVVTASSDATACVIKIDIVPPASPRVERLLKGHTAAVNAAEWSADGALVVTASNDGTARVWSPASGKPIVASLRHESGTAVLVGLMTADGRIVTAGADQIVRIWELPTATTEMMATFPATLRRKLVGHASSIVTAALAPDHRQLATGDVDGRAKIWDLDSGQEIATYEHGDVVSSLAFVPGVAQLASGSRDGTARIWNTQPRERRLPLDSAINAIAVAPDGTVAAGLDDSRVMLVRANGELDELVGHLGSVRAIAFTPDGKQLISAGDDPAAIVWSLETGKHTKLAADGSAPVRALAIDGERVALVRAGNVEVWSLAGTRVRELRARGTLDAVAIDRNSGAIAAVGHDGSFAVWDAAGRDHTPTSVPGSPYNAVAWSPSGDALVTAGPGVAHVWHAAGGIVDRLVVPLDDGTGIVRTVLVDDSRVITAGDDGHAIIWDRAKGKKLGTRDRHDKPITSIALHRDTLWIGSEDETLSAWKVGIERGDAAAIKRFMDDKHVPVELVNDVVRKKQVQ